MADKSEKPPVTTTEGKEKIDGKEAPKDLLEKEAKEIDELLKKETPERKVLLKIAADFLMEGKLEKYLFQLSNDQLIQKLQIKYQEHLANYFKKSGLAQEVRKLAELEKKQPTGVCLDEQINNLIALRSQGTHGWADMLPKLKEMYPDSGLNCTLGSAMLHLALEEVGLTGIRTVLREGHQIVIREHGDGSLTLYDPASASTDQNGKLTGYAKTFTPKQVVYGKQVDEGNGRKGYSFQIQVDEKDQIGGLTQLTDGKYTQKFYAYDRGTMNDIVIALSNLSEIKDDAQKAEKILESGKVFNKDTYKAALVEYILANNETNLTDADIQSIKSLNRQLIEELLTEAARVFGTGAAAQNPFKVLTSPLLHAKSNPPPPPNPNRFIGPSEQDQQAKEICDHHPDLRQLDFKTIKAKFRMFDGHDHL